MNIKTECNTKRTGKTYFDIVKENVFAFPFNEGSCDLNDEGCPFVEAYGSNWQFIVQDPMEPCFMKSVTNKMGKEWEVSAENLLEYAKENIRMYLPYAAYIMLYGKATRNAVVPVIKLYLKDKSVCPPFGASMILLDEVTEKIYQCIGNFCIYPADMETVYVLPTAVLRKLKLDPLQSFESIMRDTPEERPMFFRPEPLFPNGKIKTKIISCS